MKATIVLIADNEAENFGRKMMMEEFFDGFAKGLSPFDIEFVDMDVFPSNVLNGVSSGCMSLRVKETLPLVESVLKHMKERMMHW